MPVFNRETFLVESIESILNQSYDDLELIIADDGSTDGSAGLIRKYAGMDSRIHAVFLPHIGLPRTLNTAVSLAAGAMIAFMDSDDIAHPDRLKVQIEWMRKTKVDICGSQCEVFGSETDSLCGKDGITHLPESHEAIVREFLFGIPMWRGAMMIKTEICRQHPFDETLGCTDCEWPQRLVLKYTMGNVPRTLLYVRRHGNNITTILNAAHRIEATKSHFRFFYDLFPRTPIADYIVFRRVVDRVPMATLNELRRAGQWLVDLARSSDEGLRRRMAKRWQETCERSADLGQECQAVFRHFREQIDIH